MRLTWLTFHSIFFPPVEKSGARIKPFRTFLNQFRKMVHSFLQYFTLVSLTLLALSILPDSAAFDFKPSPPLVDYPICVVGAGFAGLGVANLLQKKGLKVEVFEADGRVGGKARTFRQSDQVLIEMCPLFYTAGATNLLNYINQFGFTSLEFNQNDRAGFDATTGFVSNLPTPSPAQLVALQDALQRFEVYRSQYIHDFDLGYLTSNPDLFVSMADWLEARNLTALLPVFVPLVTVQGYGELTEVPALYVLQEFSSLVTGAQPFLTVSEGLDALVNKMAEPLKVFLNHKASRILRLSETRQDIYFNFGTPFFSVKQCNKVILAFPPLLVNLWYVLIDMSPQEREILDQVRIQRYTTGGHLIPSLEHNIYYEAFTQQGSPPQTVLLSTPPGNGEPVGLVRQSTKKLQNVYSSYSYQRGSFRSAVPPLQLQQFGSKLQSFLKKLNPASQTYFLHATEYFPHVTVESLQQGFYQKFDRIQGTRGLFYATPLLSFETMEKTLEMAAAFVQKYF